VPVERIVGVDISKERIKRLKSFCPFAEGIVADVQNLKQIPDNSFDIAISNQVIEHVPDDSKMLKEVYRILKPNGYFYVSTVIKKWYGFWIYWNNGFKLDPTHVREYKSKENF
jgi:ubiquinone/menaquinone biosynthesis C-methylase UbiE